MQVEMNANPADVQNAELAEWVADWVEVLNPDRVHWCDGSDEEYDRLCDLMVDFLHRTRGVNRAVTLHLWSRTGDELGFRRSTTASFKRIAAFLAECDDEIAHPSARQACEFGLLTLTSTAQDRLLFGDRSGIQLKLSRRALKAQLAALLLSYLRTSA